MVKVIKALVDLVVNLVNKVNLLLELENTGGQSLSEAGIREAEEELGRQVAAEQAQQAPTQQQEIMSQVEKLLDPTSDTKNMTIQQNKDGDFEVTQKSVIKSTPTPAAAPVAAAPVAAAPAIVVIKHNLRLLVYDQRLMNLLLLLKNKLKAFC